MKKKIHLHIGTHKTGTTSVQRFCSQNEKLLLDFSILYPKSGRPLVESVSYGHHLLPWSLTLHNTDPDYWAENISKYTEVWDQLIEEIDSSACRQIFLSSEEFDTLSAANITYIFNKLVDYDVYIYLYLRRVDLFLQSMYATDVVYNGEEKDIALYQNSLRTPIDYSEIKNRWIGVFGLDRIKISPYRADYCNGWNIIYDMLNSICPQAVDGVVADLNFRENQSLPWFVVNTIRVFNRSGYPESAIFDFVKIMRKITKNEPFDKNLLLLSERVELIDKYVNSTISSFTCNITENDINWFNAKSDSDIALQKFVTDRNQHYAALIESFRTIKKYVYNI